MGRHRPLEADAPATDPEFDFQWLRTTLMASEPGSPAAAISGRLLAEAKVIQGRIGSAEGRLAALWEVVDQLGARRTAEGHLAYMHRVRERRESGAA